MDKLTLRVLRSRTSENHRDQESVQAVLESAPHYSLKISGSPVQRHAAQELFSELPPGKGLEDKFVIGIYSQERLIGCADVVRYYPDNKTAMLGLLLISENTQGRGFGRAAFEQIEGFIQKWSGTQTIRIGVVATNHKVGSFWEKVGFKKTEHKKPYVKGEIRSEVWVYEKSITSPKQRCTLKVELKPQVLDPEVEILSVKKEQLEPMSELMARCFRGTIDDEGETEDHFAAEIQAMIQGKYGPFLSDASFMIQSGGRTVSATWITLWKEKPLLAFSITDPEYQGRGLARALIRKSMNALIEMGYGELHLGVTRGNDRAERLYRRLGFKEI